MNIYVRMYKRIYIYIYPHFKTENLAASMKYAWSVEDK